MASIAEFEGLEFDSTAPVLLLVEDDVLIRAVVSEYLRETGFTVIEAAHAGEALAVLESPTPLAAMITDVRMPGDIDGLELAVRARSDRPDLRIVITSGDVSEVEALKTCDLFLRKPYDVIPLVDQVKQLTARRT